jgi:hypothetical protein
LAAIALRPGIQAAKLIVGSLEIGQGLSEWLEKDIRRPIRSVPMWVLMYVFSYSVSPAATADRAEWRLRPTVVFQEFSTEERCKAAKSTLESGLKEAGAKLRSGLEDLKSIGKADPAQIIIAYNVECLPK